DRTVTGVQTCALPIWRGSTVSLGGSQPSRMKDTALSLVDSREYRQFENAVERAGARACERHVDFAAVRRGGDAVKAVFIVERTADRKSVVEVMRWRGR